VRLRRSWQAGAANTGLPVNREHERRFRAMTQTRYLTDALETTDEHISEYLTALKEAESTGESRAAVINFHFDLLAFDIDLRFMQTVGLVKALVLLAKGARMKVRATALLKRTLADLAFIEKRCGDNDLRPNKRGNDHNAVCSSIFRRCDASIRLWADFAVSVAALKDKSPMAAAGPAIIAQIMLDYDMLGEQFRDFMHDGTAAIAEDNDAILSIRAA
jgi:hypothetical protein